MKKLLIGLLVLGSISVMASEKVVSKVCGKVSKLEAIATFSNNAVMNFPGSYCVGCTPDMIYRLDTSTELGDYHASERAQIAILTTAYVNDLEVCRIVIETDIKGASAQEILQLKKN